MMPAPVLTSRARREQATFRALLASMARPGLVRWLVGLEPELGPWAALMRVLEALLDHEVSVGFVGGGSRLHEGILRGTGARSVAPQAAAFVVAPGSDAVTAIAAARCGELDRPELGATVIVACESVGSGPVRVELTGPGVDGSTLLAVSGLDEAAFAAFAERNAAFPLGIDLVLVGNDGTLACLPRSCRVRTLLGRGEEDAWATHR